MFNKAIYVATTLIALTQGVRLESCTESATCGASTGGAFGTFTCGPTHDEACTGTEEASSTAGEVGTNTCGAAGDEACTAEPSATVGEIGTNTCGDAGDEACTGTEEKPATAGEVGEVGTNTCGAAGDEACTGTNAKDLMEVKESDDESDNDKYHLDSIDACKVDPSNSSC
jgi:hypothetical protein